MTELTTLTIMALIYCVACWEVNVRSNHLFFMIISFIGLMFGGSIATAGLFALTLKAF